MLRRWMALLAVAAAVVGGVWAAQNWQGDWLNIQVGERVAESQASVKPRDLDLVCPGGYYQSGGASGTKVGSFNQQGDAEVLASTSGEPTTTLRSSRLDRSNFTDLSGSGQRQVASSNLTDPAVLSLIDPNGVAAQGSALLTATQLQAATAERARGLAGTACQRPSSDIWLLGGDTRTGREGLLILQNPSRVETVVSIEAWGKAGKLRPVGASSIVIPAGETSVVPLSTIATDSNLVAVHLKASGGNIAAWLQQKTVRGLAAGGLELIAPNLGPTVKAVIPAIEIRGSASAKKLVQQNLDFEDVSSAFAVFVPGSAAANLTVEVLGANDRTFGTVVQQKVEPGVTTLIQLTDLEEGSYTAFINSDVPIVSAVRFSHSDLRGTPQTDFAWAQPAAAFTSRVVAVPQSAGSRLFVANLGDTDAMATVTNLISGATLQVKVSAGGFTAITAKAGSIWGIQSAQPISATLVSSNAKGVTSIAIEDYQNLGGKVRVQLR